jgi:hypothetical protein
MLQESGTLLPHLLRGRDHAPKFTDSCRAGTAYEAEMIRYNRALGECFDLPLVLH